MRGVGVGLDVERVRGDFPILQLGEIYLDSTATSLTPEPVLKKMLEYYRHYRANVERGVYSFSQRATDEYEKARRKVAGFLNARSDGEIIFTRNATEGINLVANGLQWRKGDKIVTTLLEHHSNLIVWMRVAKRWGVDLEVIPPNKEGVIDLSAFERAVNDRTRLVATTHASNVLGVVLPVEEIARIARGVGALTLIDGAQTVPHMMVDVQKLGCDFLAFSGHKMLGPTGAGALYMRSEHQETLEPTNLGGGNIVEVKPDGYILDKGFRRFEAGTPPIAEAIGLGAAVDYLKALGAESIKAHDRKLTEQIYRGLSEIPGVRLHGPEPGLKLGITSFNVGKLDSHDVALTLDAIARIAVRSGFHCAQPLIKTLLGEEGGTVRASTYIYNTEEEAEKLVLAVAEVAREF